MRLELLAGRADPRNNTVLESTAPEMFLDEIPGTIPEALGDYPVYSFVSEDYKMVVLHGYIKQDSVPLPGVVHFKEVEEGLCPLPGVAPVGML